MTPTERLDMVATLVWGASWAGPAAQATGVHPRTTQRCWAAAIRDDNWTGPALPPADHQASAGVLRAVRELLVTALEAVDGETED